MQWQMNNTPVAHVFFVLLLQARFSQTIKLSSNSSKPPPTVGKSHAVSLTFVGDVSLGGAVGYYHSKGLFDYTEPFKRVRRILVDSDLTIGNHESVMVESKTALKRLDASKTLFIPSDVLSVKGFKFAGFNVMGIANNHMQDYGDAAANLTFNVLEKAGISAIGHTVGDWDSPQLPLIKIIKGIKIGFLCYCYTTPQIKRFSCKTQRQLTRVGSAIFDRKLFTRDMERLKEDQVDIVVVYMHWGSGLRSFKYSLEDRREAARFMSSLGAHVIVGCHSHFPRAHEFIGSTLVSYDLGNFVFGVENTNRGFYDSVLTGGGPVRINPTQKERRTFLEEYSRRSPTRLGRILRVEVNKTGVVRAQYIPIEIRLEKEKMCLQPVPEQDHWTDFCSKSNDKWCVRSKERNNTTV